MEFKLTILGSGSAVPARDRNSSAQILETHDKGFLIDCADGTQLQIMKYGAHTSRISHIFISHLHGDHFFGLIPLLTTMGMKNHNKDVHIHSDAQLETLLKPLLEYFCHDIGFNIIFEPYNALESSVIYEDRSLTVTTIPLVHSVPTAGFLFKEKNIDNPNSYAYCSDTRYTERILPIISDVKCLYHETTYGKDFAEKAKGRLHSTTTDAATIAEKANADRLIIGHFSKRYDDPTPLLQEARAIFPNTYLAYDGMTITF
ncbi:MAG: ribonuclease Z [Paludibacteraceae bacterium]|nr:ribonuclease Z [Paludibacteraceae bacterium]